MLVVVLKFGYIISQNTDDYRILAIIIINFHGDILAAIDFFCLPLAVFNKYLGNTGNIIYFLEAYAAVIVECQGAGIFFNLFSSPAGNIAFIIPGLAGFTKAGKIRIIEFIDHLFFGAETISFTHFIINRAAMDVSKVIGVFSPGYPGHKIAYFIRCPSVFGETDKIRMLKLVTKQVKSIR